MKEDAVFVILLISAGILHDYLRMRSKRQSLSLESPAKRSLDLAPFQSFLSMKDLAHVAATSTQTYSIQDHISKILTSITQTKQCISRKQLHMYLPTRDLASLALTSKKSTWICAPQICDMNNFPLAYSPYRIVKSFTRIPTSRHSRMLKNFQATSKCVVEFVPNLIVSKINIEFPKMHLVVKHKYKVEFEGIVADFQMIINDNSVVVCDGTRMIYSFESVEKEILTKFWTKSRNVDFVTFCCCNTDAHEY